MNWGVDKKDKLKTNKTEIYNRIDLITIYIYTYTSCLREGLTVNNPKK